MAMDPPPPFPTRSSPISGGEGKTAVFTEFLQGRSNDLICDGLQVSFRILGSLWKIWECGRSCRSWEKPNYHCGEMPGRAAASCVRGGAW